MDDFYRALQENCGYDEALEEAERYALMPPEDLGDEIADWMFFEHRND